MATPRKCPKQELRLHGSRYTLVNVPGGLLAIDLGFQGSSCHSNCLFVLVTSSTIQYPVFWLLPCKTRGSQTLTVNLRTELCSGHSVQRPRNVVVWTVVPTGKLHLWLRCNRKLLHFLRCLPHREGWGSLESSTCLPVLLRTRIPWHSKKEHPGFCYVRTEGSSTGFPRRNRYFPDLIACFCLIDGRCSFVDVDCPRLLMLCNYFCLVNMSVTHGAFSPTCGRWGFFSSFDIQDQCSRQIWQTSSLWSFFHPCKKPRQCDVVLAGGAEASVTRAGACVQDGLFDLR